MDRWIDWHNDFVGKSAAVAERDGNGPAQIQVTLEIEDADASGYEPIWAGEEKVGFVTSGAYGYTTGKSLAMALVNTEHAKPETALSVHVVGVERAAKVTPPSPYDPQGTVMRA